MHGRIENLPRRRAAQVRRIEDTQGGAVGIDKCAIEGIDARRQPVGCQSRSGKPGDCHVAGLEGSGCGASAGSAGDLRYHYHRENNPTAAALGGSVENDIDDLYQPRLQPGTLSGLAAGCLIRSDEIGEAELTEEGTGGAGEQLHEVGLTSAVRLLDRLRKCVLTVVSEMPKASAVKGAPPISTTACSTRTSIAVSL